MKSGRKYIRKPGHLKAKKGFPYVPVGVIKAEKAMGRDFPEKAVIHHGDRNPGNDSNNNLVVCQDLVYHNLLHRRMVALETCGHASWRKCWICKEWDMPKNVVVLYRSVNVYHKNCLKKRHKELWKNRLQIKRRSKNV